VNTLSSITQNNTSTLYETNDGMVMKIPTEQFTEQQQFMEQQQYLAPKMTNIDPQQRRSVPSIVIPPKDAEIVPEYEPEFLKPTSLGVVGVKSPDSDEESQSEISIEMFIGNSNETNSNGNTPLSADVENGKIRVLEANTVYGNIVQDKPQPPPGPPPKFEKDVVVIIGDDIYNDNDEQQLGLQVITEGTEEEEMMSPETAKIDKFDKEYNYNVTNDIISDDIKVNEEKISDDDDIEVDEKNEPDDDDVDIIYDDTKVNKEDDDDKVEKSDINYDDDDQNILEDIPSLEYEKKSTRL